MFGWLRPVECELGEAERLVYRAFYCGLCRSIGARGGAPARLTLQYDCAFLALLLSALSDISVPSEARVCAVHPLRGRCACVQPHPALDFAADVNVLLACGKLADDQKDAPSVKARLLRAALEPAKNRVSAHAPALDAQIDKGLQRLWRIEDDRPRCTDTPADAFGTLLSDIACAYPLLPSSAARPMQWLFYNLGRWIYLADAWQDRAEDAAAGRYNVFLAAETDPNTAFFLLEHSLTESCKAFDLLSMKAHASLIEHILFRSCFARTEQLLKEGVQ